MSADTSELTDDTFQDAEPAEGDRSRMSFLEHLDELRRRIIYSLYAICAGCAVSFWFLNDLYEGMTRYFSQFGGKLIINGLTDGFVLQMKFGLLVGFLIASPFVFAQMWLFVAPGLYAREKRVVLPFAVSATALFAAGVWFAHRLAFPGMFRFFASYENAHVAFFPTIKEAATFYIWMVLGFGTVFQMPIVVFFLARFGVVTWRWMLKNIGYAILIAFIVAAIVTPSGDPVNQTIWAAPMVALYVLSIGVAWMFGKKKPKAG
ncbi:MAG: twin-arginine translocase subunit TatC [Vicinamibacterales bacterium]